MKLQPSLDGSITSNVLHMIVYSACLLLTCRYKKAGREIWKVNEGDVDVAGYVRMYKNLVQVGVRGAGHMVPYDQPERAFQMLTSFINSVNPL